MHIIIAAISAIAGLMWALRSLQNSGVDLNSFNPFTWARRREWEKLYGAKPIYSLVKPMDAAAAIIVGLLKQEGEISREQKRAVIEIFGTNFSLNEQESTDLFVSSAYLVRDEVNLDKSVKNIIKPAIKQFTPEMAASFVGLLDQVARLEGTPSKQQLAIIASVKNELKLIDRSQSKWD